MTKTASKPQATKLETFADANRRVCFVCKMPERAEMETARANGVSLGLMVKWLTEERGYDSDQVKTERLRKHWRMGHCDFFGEKKRT